MCTKFKINWLGLSGILKLFNCFSSLTAVDSFSAVEKSMFVYGFTAVESCPDAAKK